MPESQRSRERALTRASRLAAPLFALPFALLTACGGGGGSSGTTPTPEVPPEPALPQCTLTITAPADGAVLSDSGDFDCSEGNSCEFLLEAASFSEHFTAIPSAGYSFSQWLSDDISLCSGEPAECTVDLDIANQTSGACAEDSDGNRLATLAPAFKAEEAVPPSGETFEVSGTIGTLLGSVLDVDTNNPDNVFGDNNSPQSAQQISVPGTIGGYLSEAGLGEPGNVFDNGDLDDYFEVIATSGDVVTLFTADYIDADLDLYLLDETGEVVDFSAGVDQIEQLTIPATGTWYINAYAYSGASNYTLTIGVANDIQAQGEPVPGEVLVEYAAESILRPEIREDLQRRVKNKFFLEEQGGDVARTRRLKASMVSHSAAMESTPKLRAKANLLTRNPELKVRWESWMLAKAVSRQPGVATAAPNFRVQSRATINDTFFDYLWHYDLINVPAAWDITSGNADVVVAVVDTGIIASHPDLLGQLLPGYDFIADAESAGDGDGLDPDPTDEGEGSNEFRSGNFHGLHITGTIAATGNNNRGIAGVAYGSRVMPLRALDANGSGTTYDILQAIRYAAGLANDSGAFPNETADVINLSVGGGGYSQIEQNLFNTVSQRGILVAAASGNEGANQVDYPGAYNHVFAVGATDGQGVVTSYSNQGTALDLVAPGGRMEADANSDGQPDGVLSTYFSDGQPEYSFLQGTSMATPHVAGVFALMKSIDPSITSDEVEALLASGALTDDLGESGRDDAYGWGLINARKAVANVLAAAGRNSNLPPQLSVSTSSINLGSSVASADIVLSNIGDGDLTINGSNPSVNWLSVNPSNTDDSGLGVWRITADRSALAAGSHAGSVQFTSTAGSATVSVNLRVDDGTGGDIGTIYVLFVDAETQDVMEQAITSAAEDYQFSISGLPSGQYEVWAGTDNDNDYFICDEGETCGAFQTMDSPVIIDVTGDRGDINFSSDYQISLPNFNSASSFRTGNNRATMDADENKTTNLRAIRRAN